MLRSALVLAVAGALAIPASAYAAAGDLDPSFSGNGKVLAPASDGAMAEGTAVDSQDRIVAVGDAGDGNVAVLRYMPDGTLDPSFSKDGVARFSFADGTSRGQAVAIDSHDRVIVAGSSEAAGQRRTTDFGVARLTASGKLDRSFSGDGKVVTHVGGEISKDAAGSVAIDAAGRIVAAGSSRVGGQVGFTLVRYRPDGTLDPSFSGDGEARTVFGEHSQDSAESVTIDSAGRIVAAGISRDFSQPYGDGYRSAVARYLPGGNLDPSFSGDGRQLIAYHNQQLDLQAVAVDDHDRILLAGTDYVFQQDTHFAVIRLRPNGALDPSFASGGKNATAFQGGFAYSVAIEPDGRIVAAGYAPDPTSTDPEGRLQFALARYTPGGALDPSFSGDGRATTRFGTGHSWANSVAIDSLGRIVAAGWGEQSKNSATRFAIARFLGS
jgi:uncharacterized delta-60 repeat protein